MHSVHFGFLFDVWMHWNFCFSWSSVLGPQKYRSAHCFHCLFIFCFFATAKTTTATVLNGWVEKYTSSFPANKFCHLFIVLLYVVHFVHSIMAFFIDTASKSRTLLSVSLSLKSIVKATNERTFLREQRWSTENGHRYAQPGNLIRENVPKAVPLSLSLLVRALCDKFIWFFFTMLLLLLYFRNCYFWAAFKKKKRGGEQVKEMGNHKHLIYQSEWPTFHLIRTMRESIAEKVGADVYICIMHVRMCIVVLWGFVIVQSSILQPHIFSADYRFCFLGTHSHRDNELDRPVDVSSVTVSFLMLYDVRHISIHLFPRRFF